MMFSSGAAGAEITVISGGAAKPGLGFVAAAFQKEFGHAIKITYNMQERGRDRLDDGEVFDVVVTTSDSLKRTYRPAGRVEKDGISIGRVGLGVQ